MPFGFDEAFALLDRTIDADGPGPATGPALADIVADVAALGLPPGAPIMIARSNGRMLLTQYLAALLAGAVPLTVSPAMPSARIAKLAATVGAGAVIGMRLQPRRYDAHAIAPVGDVHAVVLPPHATRIYPPGSALMLTSGTSGMFSACLHRVSSLMRNAARHAAAVGLRREDTMLVSLPLFYSYAIVAQALAALVTKTALVISGPPFSVPAYADAIARYAITTSSVTPTIARMLIADGRRLPEPLRMLTVGGDTLSPEHVGDLLRAGPGMEIYVTYGLTEAGPRVTTLATHAEPASRHASVGLPLDGVTTSLRPSRSNEAGELLLRSDTALIGKVGQHDAREVVPTPQVIATGDLFHIDDDGYHFFRGRLSDFIVVGGEKVSLAAVKGFVRSLPGVVQCTVEVIADAAGATLFDLDVRVDKDPDRTAAPIREAISSTLLPGERPRKISVALDQPDAFHK